VSATDGRGGGSLRFDGINVQYAHLGSGADGREWRVPCSRKDRVKPVMTSHSSLLSRSRDASSMRRVIARVDCWVPSAGLFVAASKVGGAGVLADNLPSQLMEAREAPGTIVRVFAAARSSIPLLSSRPPFRDKQPTRRDASGCVWPQMQVTQPPGPPGDFEHLTHGTAAPAPAHLRTNALPARIRNPRPAW